MLRVGLLGASRVATYAMIAPARAMAGVEVAGVAARDPGRAEAYAAEHGLGRAYDSYDALLDDPTIDLVYVGTPPSRHPEQAAAALARGKAVLVEKPFALTSAAARGVFEAARATGGAVFEAMHSPHHPLFARLASLVTGGEIGAVRRIVAEFSTAIPESDPIRWRADLGGGALMDLGVYPLAWCRRLGGDDFDVVSASAVLRRGVDESFEATLRFASGVTAQVHSSMAPDLTSARLQVEGDDGAIDVINPLAPQMGHALTMTRDGVARTETVDGPSSYEAQLAAVVASLRDGAPFPFPADDYVHSMEAIERVRNAFQ